MAPAGPARPAVLWALLFGNFVIGTGVMVVPGTLNDLSRSLGRDVASTGLLISASALVMCLGAPLLASLVAGWDRRRLLSLTLVWWGVLLLASTLATSLASLLPLRMLSVLAPAVFTPQAAACLGLLVAPSQQGRAITFVFLGWSAASVFGLPLAAWIGGTAGWRSAFALVGVLSLLAAGWLWRAMPDGIKPPALSGAAWGRTFGSRPLMLCVAVTVFSAAGQFALFSYFAPYFRDQLGASTGQLSLFFLVFGAFGLLGNLLMSRHIDRLGADRAVLLALAGMALSLLLWPLASGPLLAMVVAVPWALGCFAANSAQQARLVGLAPPLASASIALNSSGLYAGQALGAGAGSWVITQGGMAQLHWMGLGGLVLAITASVLASRAGRASAPGPSAVRRTGP